DSAFDRAAIISFAVDEEPPLDNYPTNLLTLERLVFTNNTNSGATWGGMWKGFLSMTSLAAVTATDLCFTDIESPSGALVEIMGSSDSSTIIGLYTTGTNVGSETNITEDCPGGALVEDTCIQPDAMACSFGADDVEPESHAAGNSAMRAALLFSTILLAIWHF
ncbi:MAG: hypothetical protein SGILL_010702, partial [Bacillariaceae sp.]